MAPSAPVALRLQGLTKRFGEAVAVDDVSLTLARGEMLALLGENGAGKTTLMNMLFGRYAPDAGRVRVADCEGVLRDLPPGQPQAALAAGVGMVHQHFALAENLTGFENILLGAEPLFALRRGRRAARARLEALMARTGLAAPLDEPAARLGVGERQRIEILKALWCDARILVLDEPTAVLAPQEAEALFMLLRGMARDGLSVIFISHKLPEVLGHADRIAVLRGGRLVGVRAAAEADAASLSALMMGAEPPPAPKAGPGRPGAPALRLVAARVDHAEPRRRLAPCSLTVRRGEIVGVAGVSGSGQAALAALASGLARPDAGSVELFGAQVARFTAAAFVAAGVGRIPEDRHREGVVGAMSAAENLVIERLDAPEVSRGGFLRRGAIAAAAARVLKAHDVRGPGPAAPARLMSGGNIQKLILARVLEAGPRLILANQPTRGLDVGAAAAVSARLIAARDGGAGVLLISEDLDEVLALSDRVVTMHAGRLTEAGAPAELDRGRLGRMMTGDDMGAGMAAGAGAAA
ncbi:ABC transporter ATP-binding protein [Rubrimonas cliftonensis]|uniref:Nucleoside ABC transporter ATP-binding protein n=1 Tax=Rubrimonas cliftonensis TaxID=89524 RepID=A0A1H4D6R2_9RHOB|nr:ATP-binding cassette domain-containing protein [Rubrimonas cliftonensis]SEA68248.1 nucleoside ABC transporter ATP-binding protein [Rubrimonas cliftonensis]